MSSASSSGRTPVGLAVLIETARGVVQAEEIAAASDRLEAVIFGIGDYSVDMRTPDYRVRPAQPGLRRVDRRRADGRAHCTGTTSGITRSPASPMHAARTGYARSMDRIPITATRTACAPPRACAAPRLRGKMAIHPAQLDPINAVFSPEPARSRLGAGDRDALEAAKAAGSGAVGVAGVLVDFAHEKRAREILGRAPDELRELQRMTINANGRARSAVVRVLDIATFLAAPFCGTIMGDFGAEVIKIEHPKMGDPLRGFGHADRTRRHARLAQRVAQQELHHARPARARGGRRVPRPGRQVRRACSRTFGPGTLEKWGLGWDVLREINPKLVMLRISAYGQTGPLRDKPGFARIAHGFSGLSYLAGEPGRAAGDTGFDLARRLHVRRLGRVGVLMALRHAERTGERPGRRHRPLRVDLPHAGRDRVRLCRERLRARADGARRADRGAARPLADEGRQLGRAGLQQRQDVRTAGRGDRQAGARPDPAASGKPQQRIAQPGGGEPARRRLGRQSRLPGADGGLRPVRRAVRADQQHRGHLRRAAVSRRAGQFAHLTTRARASWSCPAPVPTLSETPARLRHTGRARAPIPTRCSASPCSGWCRATIRRGCTAAASSEPKSAGATSHDRTAPDDADRLPAGAELLEPAGSWRHPAAHAGLHDARLLPAHRAACSRTASSTWPSSTTAWRCPTSTATTTRETVAHGVRAVKLDPMSIADRDGHGDDDAARPRRHLFHDLLRAVPRRPHVRHARPDDRAAAPPGTS